MTLDDPVGPLARPKFRVDGDPEAPRFGLPKSLRVPIAASTIEAILTFVGDVQQTRVGRDGLPKALLVIPPAPPPVESDVPLWSSGLATEAALRLNPASQVWVDVDYNYYRRAYLAFGLVIPPGFFLDHIQNRRSIRLRGRSHPWLRLCPVDRRVNTSGGSLAGGEGMEYEFLTKMLPRGLIIEKHQIIYADPMDLTKMLNIEPGTQVLEGVRDTEALFYPRA